MAGVNLGIAVYALGIATALFLVFILTCTSRILSILYIRRQISIMRNHPTNQPVTSGPFASSTDPDNPNPLAIHGGTYNAECDRLTAILEDPKWMGFKKDVWMFKDLGHRFYCRVISIAWRTGDWFALLWRVISQDQKARREEQMRSIPLGN